MLIQVVHAHPLLDSYSRALFEAVTGALRAGGHEVVEIDLYRLGFDPRLSEIERATYLTGAYDSSAVADLAALLGRAQGLVFVYPHWWFAMPAILKGYVDRVFGPGIAFDHDAAGGRIAPRLGHVRLFAAVTSYGSPWWLVRLVMGDPGRKVLMRGVGSLCPNARKLWLAIYDMDRADDARRRAFLARVRARFARI